MIAEGQACYSVNKILFFKSMILIFTFQLIVISRVVYPPARNTSSNKIYLLRPKNHILAFSYFRRFPFKKIAKINFYVEFRWKLKN